MNTLPLSAALVTGLVLCGGQGSRMGGADKGLLKWEGQALFERAAARLNPWVSGTVISANRNLAVYAASGYQVVADSFADFPGPLAGLAAGLSVMTTPWLLVVPCDVPGFPETLLPTLLMSAANTPAHAVCVSMEGRLQPLFLLLHKDVKPALLQYLETGRRSVHGWIEHLQQVAGLKVNIVAFQADPDALVNLNTPADWARFSA